MRQVSGHLERRREVPPGQPRLQQLRQNLRDYGPKFRTDKEPNQTQFFRTGFYLSLARDAEGGRQTGISCVQNKTMQDRTESRMPCSRVGTPRTYQNT